MGKPVDIETACRILGLDADALDQVTDADGDRLAVALQGTAMVTFLESTDGTGLQATVHNHETVEEAQACASWLMDQIRHDIAERAAYATERTMALSQVGNSPLTGFLVI